MEILVKRSFLTALLAGALAARASAAIMLIPNGAVQVRTGAGAWAPVTGPVEMTAGQETRTEVGAAAEIRFPDGSKVLLSPLSQFKVESTDRKETILGLSLGKLRAAFSGFISSRISIHTPTAVCAVRGTVFDMGADAKSTQVNMAEGVLEVQDQKGQRAVVTSEETVTIGEQGMETPHQVSLTDDRALDAVRPLVVNRESARDATRRMLEDMRNRELKSNEVQLGKDAIDAFGRRVRIEEYLLRPDNQSFKLLFLSERQDRFDWGHLIENFNSKIPDDMSQVPAIISGTFLSQTQPSNWLKSMEFYATNTVDEEKETISLGAPTRIDFSGYFNHIAGTDYRYYPQYINFDQFLRGPGVTLGAGTDGWRTQFDQHQDYGQTTGGLFTWTQSIVNNVGSLQPLDQFQLDPADRNDASPGGGISAGCNVAADTCFDHSPSGNNYFDYDHTQWGYQPQAQFNGFDAPLVNYPSGPNKADLQQVTTYPDGSTVGVEKFLVSNDGKIFDSANTTPDTFTQNGSYNLEINIKSNLFQGRDIDVLIAPEILQQKKTETTTADSLQPQP